MLFHWSLFKQYYDIIYSDFSLKGGLSERNHLNIVADNVTFGWGLVFMSRYIATIAQNFSVFKKNTSTTEILLKLLTVNKETPLPYHC